MSERNPGYWAVVPAVVRYDTHIPPNAKLLYAELSALADGRGYCFPSNAYLSEVFTLTDTSVRRLLKALSERGYINVDVTRDQKTHEVVSRAIYIGLNPLRDKTPSAQKCAEASVQKSADPSAQKSADPSAQKCSPYIMNIKGKRNSTPIAPTGGTTDAEKQAETERAMLFERFWLYYPRKVGKQAARRAWDRLKPDLLLCSKMSQALKRQMSSEEWQRDDGRYIPHPSTWLNGRRWEDEDVTPCVSTAPLVSRAPAREEDQWL